MKKSTMISKIVIVICAFLIVLAVINGFTGFINSKLTWGTTAVCIAGFSIAVSCGSCMGTKKENVSCGRIKMRFKYTDGGNADFITLCHELDEFLNEIAGGEENRAEYIPYNQLNDIQDVIVAYDNELPVGSASFKNMIMSVRRLRECL